MAQSKRKKKQKQEDFKKTKLKVGKKKLLPENHTDTTFKAKAIVLPSQSVTLDKSLAATNHRNLTLTELISQTKHHSGVIRKDAVYGIVELIDLHPHILRSQTNSIVETTARIIGDSESAVRKACLKLCTDKISSLTQDEIGPFLDLLMMVTCTAMTHIYEDVRDDSVMFLALWLNLDPSLASRYSSKLLPNFFSLLKITYSAKSSHQKEQDGFSKAKGQHWSSNSRVRILEHLHIFLTFVVKDRLAENWYFQSFMKPGTMNQVFNNFPGASKVSFENSLKGHPIYNSPSSLLADMKASQSIMTSSSSDSASNEHDVLSDAVINLYPHLISTWVETYSTVFENTSQLNTISTDLQTLALTIRLILWVWRFDEGIEREKLVERYQKFDKYVLTYFPFGKNLRVASSPKLNSALNEMNASVAEITAIYLLKLNSNSDASLRSDDSSEETFHDVSDYLMSILGSKNGMTSKISLEQLSSLMPSIWWFLNVDNNKAKASLFDSILDLAIPRNSEIYSTLLQFMHKICILQSHPHSLSKFQIHLLPESSIGRFVDWFVCLIKSLQSLRFNQEQEAIETTLQIINFFIRFDPHHIVENNIERIQDTFALILTPQTDANPHSPSIFKLLGSNSSFQDQFLNSIKQFSRLGTKLHVALSSLSRSSDGSAPISPSFASKLDHLLSLTL